MNKSTLYFYLSQHLFSEATTLLTCKCPIQTGLKTNLLKFLKELKKKQLFQASNLLATWQYFLPVKCEKSICTVSHRHLKSVNGIHKIVHSPYAFIITFDTTQHCRRYWGWPKAMKKQTNSQATQCLVYLIHDTPYKLKTIHATSLPPQKQ